MIVGIDLSQVIYGTGVSSYTKNLVENLLELDSKNQYVFFGSSLRRRGEIEKYYKSLNGDNFKGIALPFPPFFLDFLWNRLHAISVEGLVGKIDIFHSSDWAQPPSKSRKVTTVHDLVPVLYPEWSHPRIISTHERRLRWVKKEVDKIIVPSNSTKRDLIKLGFAKKRIVVIHEAAGDRFIPKSRKSIDKVKNKFWIKGKYFIAIGVTERKNTKNIVKAFMKYKKNNKDCSLVIVGYKYMEINNQKGVKFLGNIDATDIPALYSGSEALIYPSLYEGFGLPILEAMACKTPVVTSKLSSMSEVAGHAAIYVDPNDVDSITRGIEGAVKGSRELKLLGFKQSKKFSWEKTSRQTLKVYKSLVK